MSEKPLQTSDADAERRNTERFENQVILALDLLAAVNKRLTKQLVHGRVASEIVGAIADLRSIANNLEIERSRGPT